MSAVRQKIFLGLIQNSDKNWVSHKGVQELQKLHRVGKFYNGWWPDPPPPPPPPPKKKEILVPKRKYQTEKGSLTKKHKKSL